MKHSHYSYIAILLHWLMAVLIIGMLVLGLVMSNMPNSPDKFKLYGLHKATGILILCLTLFRLFWRVSHTTPPLPKTMAAWEKLVSKIVCWSFYGLMLFIPLSGWAMSSIGRHGISFYGLFKWPFLPGFELLSEAGKKTVGDSIHTSHTLLSYALILLLSLHILAALKHLVLDRDEVVYRITLLFKPRPKL